MATVLVSLGHLKSVFHRTPSTTVHGFYIKKSQGKTATMPLTQYIRALDSPQFKRKTANCFLQCFPKLFLSNFQFSSLAQSCPTLYNPMNRSTTGLHVHHQLPEFTQTHVHWVGDAIQPSVIPFSSCLQSFPASGSFPVSQFFASGEQLQYQSFQRIFRTDLL